MIALLAIGAALAQEPATCVFLRDGEPVEGFVCGEGGAWTAECPAAPKGVVRATFTMRDRQLTGEARVSLGTSGKLVLPLSGPGGRPSAFLVGAPVAGLLPGQAIGPQQLCPVVQPGAIPGAAPRELPIDVVVSVHHIVGYDEVVLDGGVLGREPRYDAGTVHAKGRTVVVQHEVPIIPILTGANAISLPDVVRGTVSIRHGETWASVGYSGYARVEPVGIGQMSVLLVDFVAPELEAAFDSEAVAFLVQDLTSSLSGAMTPLSPVWSRGPVQEALTLADWSPASGTEGWRIAEADRTQVRVGRYGHRVRVLIAQTTVPLDHEVRAAITEAATPD